MPSLIRFLVTIGVLAGLAYAAMFALVLYVEPREREVSTRIPTSQIELKRITPDNSDISAPVSEAEDVSEQ